MKRFYVILFCIIVCNLASGNSNAVITGTLGMRSLPCFDEACPAIDVVKITNDTASFVLIKDGHYFENFDELGKNYSYGSVISIHGNICKKREYDNQEVYELSITAILEDASPDNFSANCTGASEDELRFATPPIITIENDSVIIRHTKYEQCCAQFSLKISEVINDTLYVTFCDTATLQCDCMCNYAVRISAIESTSNTLKVCYNGVVYNVNGSDTNYPAPLNFRMSYKYILLDDSGYCCGETVFGPTYCTDFQWEPPNLSETEAQLTGYNVYYESMFFSETEILACTADTYVQREVGIIGSVWVTAVYSNPEGESAPSNIQTNFALPTGVKEVENQPFSLTYNKQKNRIEIEGIENIMDFRIFRLDGTAIVIPSASDFHFIDTKGIEKGVYIIKIITKEAKVISEKIIIE